MRIVSVCAGQGHDVVGALQDHPRRVDVSATLIELDDQNVRAARERVAAAGLSETVEVIEGDASITDTYDGRVPADVALVCGLMLSSCAEGAPTLLRPLELRQAA